MTVRLVTRAWMGILSCAFAVASTSWCLGQATSVPTNTQHELYQSHQPPGSIGAMQVARGVAPPGYVQPVSIRGPAGASVSLATDGGAFVGEDESIHAGLVVGQPYRLKIADIPRHLAAEVYPSIELIGRLHPPEGEKNRFPVPVEIAQSDLELALKGQMVIRVVYLENPDRAFPEAEGAHQRLQEVGPAEDPLHVADQLGRPMAIVRVGSRVPLAHESRLDFAFGAPPVDWISAPPRRRVSGDKDNLPPVVNARQHENRQKPAVGVSAEDRIPSPSDAIQPLEIEQDGVPDRLHGPLAPTVEPPPNEGRSLPNSFDAERRRTASDAADPFLNEALPE